MSSLRNFAQSLSASQRVVVASQGDYFRLVSATGAVRLVGRDLKVDLEPGMAVKLAKATEHIELEDRSGATNAVVLAIGLGAVLDDNRTEIGGTVATAEVLAGTFSIGASTGIGSGSATTILAADSTRKFAWLQADPANTDRVAITVSGGGASGGISLAPGDAIPIWGTALIAGRAASGTQAVRWFRGQT